MSWVKYMDYVTSQREAFSIQNPAKALWTSLQMLEFLFLPPLANSSEWCLERDKSRVLTLELQPWVWSVHVSIPQPARGDLIHTNHRGAARAPRCHSRKTAGWGLNKHQCTPDVWGGHLKKIRSRRKNIKKKKKIPFNAINISTKSKELAEFKLVLYESYSTSLTPSSFHVFWIKAPQRRCHSCVNFFFCMEGALFVELLYKMLLSKEYKHNN